MDKEIKELQKEENKQWIHIEKLVKTGNPRNWKVIQKRIINLIEINKELETYCNQ